MEKHALFYSWKLRFVGTVRRRCLPIELFKHGVLWTTLLVCALSSDIAIGEVLFQNSEMELSATGPRISRTCLVVLKPQLTLGDRAPVLTLMTSGLNQLTFGVGEADRYRDVVLVQNNVRRDLDSASSASFEQFLASTTGKAILSPKLFFITAKMANTGEYISSRYERLDFDDILLKIERYCPFDAETLMSNLSAREAAERLLGLSDSDLGLIRGALEKRFNGSSAKPAARSGLSSEDREHLKKYAVQNDLPASRYLSIQTAAKLKSEGSQLALAPERRTVDPSMTNLMQRAYKQLDNKDYAGARATLTDAISLDGNFAQAFSYRGFAWYLEGLTKDPEAAIAAYRQGFLDLDVAIRLDPNYATVRRHRGNTIVATYRALRGLHKPTNDILDRAIDDLREAVKLDPTSKINANALGEAYLLSGSYQQFGIAAHAHGENLRPLREANPTYTETAPR